VQKRYSIDVIPGICTEEQLAAAAAAAAATQLTIDGSN
jgi:hypothetical protein